MTSPRHPIALNPLGLDLDGFLYAQVGDDQHGGQLSVISALARVGVDPWEEAASLARLPVDGAVEALSALLARLPTGTGQPLDPVPVAQRLVALLPRGGQPSKPSLRATTGQSTAIGPNMRLTALAIAILFLLFMATRLLMLPRSTSDTAPSLTPASPATGTTTQGASPASP